MRKVRAQARGPTRTSSCVVEVHSGREPRYFLAVAFLAVAFFLGAAFLAVAFLAVDFLAVAFFAAVMDGLSRIRLGYPGRTLRNQAGPRGPLKTPLQHPAAHHRNYIQQLSSCFP